MQLVGVGMVGLPWSYTVIYWTRPYQFSSYGIEISMHVVLWCSNVHSIIIIIIKCYLTHCLVWLQRRYDTILALAKINDFDWIFCRIPTQRHALLALLWDVCRVGEVLGHFVVIFSGVSALAQFSEFIAL